jgi:hypothetical protein
MCAPLQLLLLLVLLLLLPSFDLSSGAGAAEGVASALVSPITKTVAVLCFGVYALRRCLMPAD